MEAGCEQAIEELGRVAARDGEDGATGDGGQQRHGGVNTTAVNIHTMSSSCSALLGALKACLLESDCVQKHGRLPSECLKHHTDELPEACQNLRKATYECKRNMVRGLSSTQRRQLKRELPAGHAKEIPGQYGGHGRERRAVGENC